MASKAGKADRRGIVSTKKCIDYLDELGSKHLNESEKSLQKECVEYLKEVEKTYQATEKENLKFKTKLKKLMKRFSREELEEMILE